MGRCWFFGVLAVVGCACLIGNVVGYPKEDLVEKLPGQPKVGFKQYAGYVDVDVKNGRSLFYYFVEADHDPQNKPLTLWLNGGPGCSSVGGGAFSELGPFYPKGDGRVTNLLFIESPVGVGFSYSNTTSDYNYQIGDAATGHYIPQLADALLNYNEKSTDFKFKIKGVAIGNPLLKMGSNEQARYEYFWSHGMISDELGLTIKKECNFNVDASKNITHNDSESCSDAKSEASKIVGSYINKYDIILDVCYPAIAEQELRLHKTVTKISIGVDVCMSPEKTFYLNLPEVQKALHANHTNLPYKWTVCSNVLKYDRKDLNINTVPILKRIVQNHIPLWIFSGDQDAVVPLSGTRTLIRELAQELKFNISVPYGAWFHDHQVGGWVIEYGNILTFATVRGAAHMVPFAQPSRALELFSNFVLGKRLPNTTHPSID
ncbi:unnamed protein product [Lupinus luteus]|uniref:Uncharacterized protein n=1 Tax=Lupinus luteus TaxID=3873 RepID=A0AAV1XEQ9_LUPLU